MAVTVVSTTTHSALVPWTDVDAAIAANSEKMLSTRPVLTIAGGGGVMMPGSSGLSALSLSWSMTPQRLDEILRVSIEGLPTLGLYSVTSLPGDSVNALSVSWKEES